MKSSIIDVIKVAALAIGGVIGTMIGEVNGLLYTLISFVILDYMTGVIAAAALHELDSRVGFLGIAKKIFIFVLVIVANLLDKNIIGEGSVTRTAVIFFYIANEGISILENCTRLSMPLPKKLTELLKEMKNNNEKK